MSSDSLIHAQDISKHYTLSDGKRIEVLKPINLRIAAGETVAISGYSGSGKTTLLTLLAGLDSPTHGSVHISGSNITAMNENDLTAYRARNIGFIFQRFHLLPYLTALENVMLPLDLLKKNNAKAIALEALDKVGLAARAQQLPSTLSGGECQRVAIARAIVTSPRLIFADEPTGNLDNDTAEVVTQLFFQLVRAQKLTLVIVTHNLELAARCERHLHLSHGVINEVKNAGTEVVTEAVK